ncbi:hypothetical protein [Cupriavidus sp. a3]|uniref:hypothetical protein n=1 Tax=Cupriavidus sp. a3 TaxID=3242158 RepID=UPI003D9C01E5
MSNLRLLRETSLLDVPSVLRNLADAMERGEHDQVNGCVVVWDADTLEVSYAGTGEAAPNAHLLLHAGAAKMMARVIEGKG